MARNDTSRKAETVEGVKGYDKLAERLAPMKDALHLFARLVLTDLPGDAHVLCVGVGNGAELFDMAKANPGWRFTAIDPAKDMLDKCRKGAEQNDMMDRCTFHEGYLDSLPGSNKFDAATCFLVSHFLTNRDERIALFAGICDRLKPGGLLVNADISGDRTAPEFESLLNVWIRMLEYSQMPQSQVERMRSSLGRNVAVLPPKEMEALLVESGFTQPVLFFQSLLIHAWYSRV